MPAVVGEVDVVVNGETGEIAVAGNSPDNSSWLLQNTMGRWPRGLKQILGDDAASWAAVACIKTTSGSYLFEEAGGQPSKEAALALAKGAALQRTRATDGTFIPNCGFARNKTGPTIRLRPGPSRL